MLLLGGGGGGHLQQATRGHSPWPAIRTAEIAVEQKRKQLFTKIGLIMIWQGDSKGKRERGKKESKRKKVEKGTKR